jgi:hypothetical protein
MGRKKDGKKRVYERLQKIYNFITNFYGEEMINKIILFYQNLRYNSVIKEFSDKKIDME